ncbi:MAG: QueT transporter family protein [Oscillospiraceae bacterium]|jgi:uncharacterized membrane protein|nr:QueT transporter family protein [Oscillospiraceae bacterium]
MKVRKIIFGGVIAALYVALTYAIIPLAYTPIQFRLSEVLTILPFYFPIAVPGLFVGCIIANLLSPYGVLDMVVGSAATLLAGLCTLWIGLKMKQDSLCTKSFACLPPVIFNAVFVGAMIAYIVSQDMTQSMPFWSAFLVFGLQVGFGQLVVLYAIGLPLLVYLPKTDFINRLQSIYKGA